MKVIALDFDGVVADTEGECYAICIPAFRRMREKIDENQRVKRQFRKARSYVKQADCYYTVLKILQDPKENFDDITFQEFSKYRDKNEEKGKEFHKLFYEERAKLQKNIRNWLELNPPFKQVPKILNKFRKDFPLVIVTSKDKASTKMLLESYGISVEDGNILPKEFSLDKKDQMRFISKKFDVPLRDIVFVEDNLEQLLNVNELGIKLILASWGYNTKEQRKEVKKLGINVTTIKNFEKAVKSL